MVGVMKLRKCRFDMKTYTYNARFHNNKQATFSGNIQTNESDIDEIVKLLKKDMNKRYGDIFILHQDISYFDAVNENGEIIFKWCK